ncbi:MAG: TlpA family protein disulfide reductase [Gammaproteobacteria bacterium]|nr:TlpA family protein disulfide reductase [Gammaproteobacteria bacterium]
MPTKLITILLAFCALSASAFLLSQPSFPTLSEQLVLQRIDGQQQQLGDMKGMPLLITFWSPSCVPCMQEVKQLNQLYTELEGGRKFELLALSMVYDRPDQVIQSSAHARMQYPVYLDLSNELSRAFGNIVATPALFLLNSDGDITYQHSGKSDFTLISQKLKKLIG